MSKVNSYVFVIGSSCTGKTRLSINIGKTNNLPIINCDSLQVYQRVNIGTAKPTATEMKQCPHYLFDIVPTGQSYTVANYVNDVVKTVTDKSLSQALFVGGSGFYIQALEKGLYPNAEPTQEVKEKVWEMIDELGFAGVYQWLQEKDPEYAQMVSVNDHYRIRRGLEILFSQNLTISQLKKEMEKKAVSPLPAHRRLKVGLYTERDKLRDLVRERAKSMVEQGFVQEVESLISEGYGDWSPMNSVGYKEVKQFLQENFSVDELVEKITISTMQLAKKQTTWFKRDSEITWFASDEWQKAQSHIEKWLRSSPT